MTWLRQVYLYYYCLPIWKAVGWVLGVTGGFWLLRHLLGKKKFWRPGTGMAAVLWAGAIVLCTLLMRDPGTGAGAASWVPFHSYFTVLTGGNPELLRANFMNTVLFYPLGLLGGELLPEKWTPGRKIAVMACAALAFSAGIEVIQVLARCGYGELDDMIHNTAGMCLGVAAGCGKITQKRGQKL